MGDMETRSVRWQSTDTRRRASTRRHTRGKKEEGFSTGERRRLRQLAVCLLLFAMVFIGRGLPGGQLDTLRQTLGTWVQRDTDFKAVFSQIGQSVSDGKPFTQTVGLLWSEIFGEDTAKTAQPETPHELPQGEQAPPEDITLAPTGQEGETQPDAATSAAESEAARPPAPAPDNLVGGAMATPVMGVLTSAFGYRTHPIDGEWKQHDGIDIMANEGTNIGAFADGVVDFVGESPSYGLYLQLKHANGITSFYAHCSKIVVKNGQNVKAGDKIALVGATGDVTGPHLHLEMKQNGTRIDPSMYVETKSL